MVVIIAYFGFLEIFSERGTPMVFCRFGVDERVSKKIYILSNGTPNFKVGGGGSGSCRTLLILRQVLCRFNAVYPLFA